MVKINNIAKTWTWNKKKKKNSSLIFKIIAIAAIAVAVIVGGYFIFRKKDKDNKPSEGTSNLGEQQNQQTQSAVLQLAGNLLGNANNLNQLTQKPGGGAKTIQEIEEEFLISAFQPGQSPVGGISGGLSPEVIERIWWELRPWIEEYLRDPNQSILDHAREKFRRDVENWLKWQQREYNRQLEEYLRRLQELQRIEDLIREYQKIREEELLEKISRKTELRNKGYVDRDIEKLREWNLIAPNQEIPDLMAEKRIGATNILWTMETSWGEGEIGGSSDLIIFLKPSSRQTPKINFSINIVDSHPQKGYRFKEYYEKIIRDFLTEKGKSNNDAYVLIRQDTSASGDSAGIAFYLGLHSLVNRIPLPRNLGSTGTVEGEKVGAIGGLKTKIKYNVKKEKPINIFILSETNYNKEGYQKVNPGFVTSEPEENWFEIFSPRLEIQPKQVHFIIQKNQIEIALNEILNNTIKDKVHVCGKEPIPDKKPEKPEPRGPPEKPEQPNSKITAEQLLSLITELSIREKQGENQDFWEKLQTAYAKNTNYLEAVNQAKNLRQEYVGKLEKLQNSPGERNPNQGKKIRRFIYDNLVNLPVGYKKEWEEEVEEKDKMICKVCRQQFEGGYTEKKQNWWWCFEHGPGATQRMKEVDKVYYIVSERKTGGDGPPTDIEQQKKQLYQEYENKFKEISTSVANLTPEILTNLEKNGYALAEIEWTGKLQAPSLTANPSIKFSLAKK